LGSHNFMVMALGSKMMGNYPGDLSFNQLFLN